MAILEVTFKGTLVGQAMQNVLHFEKSTWALTDYAPMASHLATNFLGTIASFQPNQAIWTAITIRNITTPTEAPFTSSIVVPGTSSGIEGMPPFVCFLWRFQTATAGRTGRGRMYIGAPNAGHVNVGFFTSAIISFIAPKIVTIKNFYGPSHSSDYQLGVCPRGNPAGFKPVTDITMDTIPRVQRRRNIGVGI